MYFFQCCEKQIADLLAKSRQSKLIQKAGRISAVMFSSTFSYNVKPVTSQPAFYHPGRNFVINL
jgi:hypothetical protein